MSKIGVLAAVYFFVVLLALTISRAYMLYTDSGYHGWPAVTRCRICNERIWAWQAYERRELGVDVDNPQHLAVSCSMSCLFHKGCQGTPALEPIRVTCEHRSNN